MGGCHRASGDMMSSCRNYVLALCLVALLVNQHAYAQALPVANFVINRAMAGVVTRVAAARGFAANDPRIAATLTGMGTASTAVNVASTVAGVGLTLAGAPVWMTIAAGLGVMAVGAAIYANTSSGPGSISISANNKIEVQSPMPQAPAYSMPALNPDATDIYTKVARAGIPTYRTASCASTNPTCSQFPSLPGDGAKNFMWKLGDVAFVPGTFAQVQTMMDTYVRQNGGYMDGTTISYVSVYWVPNADGTSKRLAYSVSGTQTDCGSGTCTPNMPFTNTFWLDQVQIGAGVLPAVGPNLDSVAPAITEDMKAAKLDAMTLARLTDNAWRQAAAQPGYEGLPYSYAQPVTYTDASGWMQENPTANPTVGDLLTPGNNPGSQTVPISPTVTPTTSGSDTNPGSGLGTNVNVVNTPNVNVVNKVQVDLGTVPNVGTPGLEVTPTARSILDPLLSLMPDLKAFSTPQHQGECPKPTAEVLSWHVTFDSHCQLAEETRQMLYQTMMVCWALAALLIILTA